MTGARIVALNGAAAPRDGRHCLPRRHRTRPNLHHEPMLLLMVTGFLARPIAERSNLTGSFPRYFNGKGHGVDAGYSGVVRQEAQFKPALTA
jgi:hypothetical protein